MFGHPTGLGALFVKKQRRQTKPRQRMQGDLSRSYQTIDHIIEIQKQRRHYFGGGSVDVVMPHVDFTIPRNSRRRSSQIEASIKAKELEEECVEFDSLVNGTQHFRGIVELMHGFRELNELGGMSEVREYVCHLRSGRLYMIPDFFGYHVKDIFTFNLSSRRAGC
jgi:hypothetical protein